jgi:hypothetical protein
MFPQGFLGIKLDSFDDEIRLVFPRKEERRSKGCQNLSPIEKSLILRTLSDSQVASARNLNAQYE